jgi:hypothetical protein
MTDLDRFISASDRLTGIFGHWPSFHDAEVVDFNLWRGGMNSQTRDLAGPVLTLKVHLWEMTKEVDSKGYFILRNHTLCTLRFREVQEIQMQGFNDQNAIFDLSIERKERNEPPSPYFAVEIEPAFGIQSSFECLHIEVVEAVPFIPGGTPAL